MLIEFENPLMESPLAFPILERAGPFEQTIGDRAHN